MLATKMFEVRDRHTLIAVMATYLAPENKAEQFLLGRSGFRDGEYLILTQLDPVKSGYDVNAWDNTLREAHKWILANFDFLESGTVVDVEFIAGETDKPKVSEAFCDLCGE